MSETNVLSSSVGGNDLCGAHRSVRDMPVPQVTVDIGYEQPLGKRSYPRNPKGAFSKASGAQSGPACISVVAGGANKHSGEWNAVLVASETRKRAYDGGDRSVFRRSPFAHALAIGRVPIVAAFVPGDFYAEFGQQSLLLLASDGSSFREA